MRTIGVMALSVLGLLFASCGGDEDADFSGGNESGASGSAGTAGAGGSAGSGGVAGAGGSAGSSGTGGSAGSAGLGGAAGQAGAAGNAGAAGTAGSAGSAGSSGAAGTAGSAGAAGAGGSTGTPPHAGLSFWAVDLPNERGDSYSAHDMTWSLSISNVGSSSANVVVERNDADPGQPLQLATVTSLVLAPGGVQHVELEPREVTGVDAPSLDPPMTALSSKALRLTSDQPVVVVQMNPSAASHANDGTVLLPADKLGASYRVIGWPTANPVAPIPITGVPDHGSLTIVGNSANTQVTVHTTHAILGNGSIPDTPAGGTITATLGPFDVLNLASDDADGDLSGTRVEATAPVAVFTSGERIIAPSPLDPAFPLPPGSDAEDSCCADHYEEQLPPSSLLGSRFVIAHSPYRSDASFREPDIIRLVGGEATAQVTTNLPAPFDSFSLAPGEVHDIWTQGDAVVQSSEPILVGQVLVSSQRTTRQVGDPSLTLVPPLSHHGNHFDFLVPPDWDETYVTIVARDGTDVTLDGAPVSCETAEAGVVQGETWAAWRCTVGDGVHTVSASSPVGVVVYGYGSVGSFTYVAGGT